MHPSGLCRSQNYETRAGADADRSARHILKVGIPSLTIRIRKEWEGRGETTIPAISRQHIGGATKKKDQPEWMSDVRSVAHRVCSSFRNMLSPVHNGKNVTVPMPTAAAAGSGGRKGRAPGRLRFHRRGAPRDVRPSWPATLRGPPSRAGIR